MVEQPRYAGAGLNRRSRQPHRAVNRIHGNIVKEAACFAVQCCQHIPQPRYFGCPFFPYRRADNRCRQVGRVGESNYRPGATALVKLPFA